jgi:diguanylate cyclase (GGDEF)-like protein/PAS domain S-box-containing protein
MQKPALSAAHARAESEPVARTARRINRRSLAVITLVALTGGIAGFAVMRDTSEQSVSRNLMLTANTSSTSLAHALEVSLWFPRTVATRATLTQALDRLERTPDDSGARNLLQGIAESFIAAEIASAEVYDGSGRLAARAGSSVRSKATVTHRLSNTGQDAALAWADGYVLVAENKVLHAGREVGRVITEQRLPLFDGLLKDVRASSEASDAAICGREGDAVLCAPNRLKSTAFTIPMFDASGQPSLPICRAVLGERGVMRVTDRRGIEVMSAFAPIKDYGLGFAVKIDLDTLYAPQRAHTGTLVLVLVAVIVMAIFIQRRLVRPVLARLVETERGLRTLTAVFDATTDYLVQNDAQGRIIYMNAAARRRTGVALDAPVEHLTLADFNPPQTLSRFTSEVGPTAASAGVWVGESLVWDAERREFPVSHIAIAHRDKHGNLEYFSGLMRDISSAKAAEQALRESEHRLRMVTDNLPVLIAYLDRDLRFRFLNKTYRQWFGDAAPQPGSSVREFYGEAAWAEFGPRLHAALGGVGVVYDREMIGPEGTRHVQVTVVPDRDEQGSVVGLYALISDVSSYREAQRALQESEARLRTMADALPMRVAYVDAQERYQFNNLAYERAFKKSPAELYGKTVRELLGDAAYQAAEPNIRRVLSGEPVTFQSEMANGGNYVHYEAHYIPQFATDDGRVLGFHAVVSDITRQKLEERRLQQLARVDPLTGVVNRAGFELRLAEAMERCRGSGALMALMYLDIDRFKQINDQFGHNVGDALLRLFAGRLSRTLRSTDTIARLGGDEFTVIMEGLPRPEIASTVAAKIVQAMSTPFVVDSHTIGVTTSIGLAFHHGDSVTADELVKQADVMLYQAKDAGRNNVQMALRVTAVARA